MLGSSRSLSKPLATVFDARDSAADWRNIPDPAANDESRAVYEIFFLDLLVRLQLLMAYNGFASVATEFMHKCQQFVHALTDLFVGADPVLVLARHTLAQRVMKRVLRVYVAKDRDAYDHAERVLVLEHNCCLLLQHWCHARPNACFTLLDSYFVDPACRLKVLAVLMRLAASPHVLVAAVADTLSCTNLLRSLCYDTSEAVLCSSLGALVMLMGKACHRMGVHLPDLLLVYARLVLWSTTRVSDDASVAAPSWALAGPDT
ncbi:hypothetical protein METBISCDRAFT_28740 [Metschnikowia bicuspidata]|uniref:Uncharacterized protein n=1 Tax=Metschnikowia bicuspidata TaxID=27322 RepID=A0A4P9Z821_9ASCO|nr:hypothetical protein METBISCDRAFT_28740 [Metschnikowia bicuspidata]